jgi:hypothetical protein
MMLFSYLLLLLFCGFTATLADAKETATNFNESRSRVSVLRREQAVARTTPIVTASRRGDITCKYGDADCNMCAKEVEKQYYGAFDGAGMDWRTLKWHFSYGATYPPANDKPTAGGIASNVIYNHIQGFVRTNNDTIPYAATHNNNQGARGGFFFTKTGRTRNYLYSMHLSNSYHPYSVAEIGQFVVSAEGSDLRFFDLRSIASPQNVRKSVPGLKVGGGLALARLADGAHLLVASSPGAHESGQRYTDFYRMDGPLTGPTTVTLLSRVAYSQPLSWSETFQYSENLSLITECDTGRLYTIHTSGEEDVTDLTDPQGYWRLSRVDWDANGKPMLTTLAARKQDSNFENCHHRSTATVHVASNNKLGFYCHERNVVKAWWDTSDYFSFLYGTPK